MQCVPTSIAGEYLTARADVRQNGCRAAVKAIASPEATAQAVMVKCNELFDRVSRHVEEVVKLRPRGLVKRQDVALQRHREMIVAHPYIISRDFWNYVCGDSYRKQQNDR